MFVHNTSAICYQWMAVGDNGHTGIPMTTELDTMVTIIQATTREATPVTTLGKIHEADLTTDLDTAHFEQDGTAMLKISPIH